MGKRKAAAEAQTPSKDKMDVDGEDEESDEVNSLNQKTGKSPY